MLITMFVCNLNKLFEKKLLFSLQSSKFCVLSLFFSQNLWWWVVVEWIIKSTHTTWTVHNKNKNGGWLKRKYANKARTWNHCHFLVFVRCISLFSTQLGLHSLSLPHWLVCWCACVYVSQSYVVVSLSELLFSVSRSHSLFTHTHIYTCTCSRNCLVYVHVLYRISYIVFGSTLYFVCVPFLKNVDIVRNCQILFEIFRDYFRISTMLLCELSEENDFKFFHSNRMKVFVWIVSIDGDFSLITVWPQKFTRRDNAMYEYTVHAWILTLKMHCSCVMQTLPSWF